ncbi:unnamed protein product [Ostreobium quekettii]|uniref:TOG domain-containing protein n=1 Tax=Ostreobium quekettii TaxID=121088 RepID=A0A8S1J7R7_9CHLO|nr:unnamed protein product [Ostreobium quekettii]
MKRARNPDECAMNQGDNLTVQGDPCKVPKTSSEQNPSGPKDAEGNGAGKQTGCINGAANASASPLQPMAVNEAQEAQQPTAKEAAAAKAARIRLGLEKDDGTLALAEQAPPKLPSGVERKVDIEYVASADLQRLEHPKKAAEGLLDNLAAKDWVAQCDALNLTRQLAVHHKEDCHPLLAKVVPAVTKLVKSLRSSVCKTAMLCCADLFTVFKEAMVEFVDVGGPAKPATSLLCQLLLRAANDKQFVVEETQRTLAALSSSIPPLVTIQMAVPYTKHRNPKVRGKAAVLLVSAVGRMSNGELQESGLEALLEVAAGLVTDSMPDAREGARQVLGIVKGAFLAGRQTEGKEEEEDVEEEEEDSEPRRTPWQEFCHKALGAGKAKAVVKATQ